MPKTIRGTVDAERALRDQEIVFVPIGDLVVRRGRPDHPELRLRHPTVSLGQMVDTPVGDTRH